MEQQIYHPEAFAKIVTRSPKMYAIFRYIESIAPSSQPVLVTGETGAGKEMIVQAIHTLSQRKGAFIAVNVAGLMTALFPTRFLDINAARLPERIWNAPDL